MIYKNSEWYALLDRFADGVAIGTYKKTNYSAWRDMKNWHGADIWSSNGVSKYTVEDFECPFNYHDFDVNDNSFGTFLNDIWLEHCSNIDIKADYMAWEEACKELDETKREELIETNPINYIIDEDGSVKCYDSVTGEFMEVSSASVSTLSDTTYSTKVIAGDLINTSPTLNSVNVIKGEAIKPNTATIHLDEVAMKAEVNSVYDRFEELNEAVKELSTRLDTKMDIINEKENNKMKMFGNFEFGKVDGNTVRMSMYGLAVRNANGTWVSYNVNTGEVIDVDVMNFDGSDLMYKMPVAIDQIKPGDMVIHNRKPVYVTGVADGKLTAIDVIAGEEKVVLLTRNMFGFNFVTKVVSLMDMAGITKPSAENPFGNMWMLALMGDNKEFDFKDMLMMQMLSGQTPMNGMNPMLMMMLAKDGTADNDMMMALALSGAFNTPVATN